MLVSSTSASNPESSNDPNVSLLNDDTGAGANDTPRQAEVIVVVDDAAQNSVDNPETRDVSEPRTDVDDTSKQAETAKEEKDNTSSPESLSEPDADLLRELEMSLEDASEDQTDVANELTRDTDISLLNSRETGSDDDTSRQADAITNDNSIQQNASGHQQINDAMHLDEFAYVDQTNEDNDHVDRTYEDDNAIDENIHPLTAHELQNNHPTINGNAINDSYLQQRLESLAQPDLDNRSPPNYTSNAASVWAENGARETREALGSSVEPCTSLSLTATDPCAEGLFFTRETYEAYSRDSILNIARRIFGNPGSSDDNDEKEAEEEEQEE